MLALNGKRERKKVEIDYNVKLITHKFIYMVSILRNRN